MLVEISQLALCGVQSGLWTYSTTMPSSRAVLRSCCCRSALWWTLSLAYGPCACACHMASEQHVHVQPPSDLCRWSPRLAVSLRFKPVSLSGSALGFCIRSACRHRLCLRSAWWTSIQLSLCMAESNSFLVFCRNTLIGNWIPM